MRHKLKRIRIHLLQMRDKHPKMKNALDMLLREYDDSLQPPLRRQIDFLHRAQRLIKLCTTKVYHYPIVLKKILSAKDPSWSQMPELMVDDELKTHLARQLFESCGACSGEKIIIATTQEGRDVTEKLITICLRNNVDFELGIKDPLRMTYLINHLDEDGLRELTNLNMKKYENVHREIIISSSTHPDIRQLLDKEKMKLYKRMNKSIHDRAMSGELHYTLTRIPTPFDADMDQMNYGDYLQLFFELCDQPWDKIEKAQQALIERFNSAKEIHIINNDGTDLTMDITGQTFANSVIAKNIPGSEIFSSPVRSGVNGELVSKGSFRYGESRIIKDISMNFVNGRIESFHAVESEEDLKKLVTLDDDHGEGSRHVGEIGIGTNPHLRKHVINSLLVEKIGGSFHIALGSCYSYTSYMGYPVQLSNGNNSNAVLHWDITTILRGKDGKIIIDGELIQHNGEWIGEKYLVLNEGWNALDESEQPDWWKTRYPNGYS